jgi:hypothetical protein
VADPVRFYFDQHMRKAVAAALRRRGVDVSTAHEAGRCGLSDEDQLRFATAEGRVVVTHDTDYLTLAADLAARGETFAGVAFCDAQKFAPNPGRLVRELLTLHGVYTADDMLNHVEYL